MILLFLTIMIVIKSWLQWLPQYMHLRTNTLRHGFMPTGSTRTRTRLYRMGLTKYLAEIGEDFDYTVKKRENGKIS